MTAPRIRPILMMFFFAGLVALDAIPSGTRTCARLVLSAEIIRGSYLTTSQRRLFEMAGGVEPTLVINQRVEALFDIAQRRDGIGRFFFTFGALDGRHSYV